MLYLTFEKCYRQQCECQQEMPDPGEFRAKCDSMIQVYNKHGARRQVVYRNRSLDEFYYPNLPDLAGRWRHDTSLTKFKGIGRKLGTGGLSLLLANCGFGSLMKVSALIHIKTPYGLTLLYNRGDYLKLDFWILREGRSGG